MRILIVDTFGAIRSTGKITTLQYQYMKKFGHEVKVCYRGIREPEIENPDFIKVAGKIEPYVGNILAQTTGLEGYFHPYATKKLKEYTKDFKPDIVQLNILHGYFINSSEYIEFLKEQRIAVSYTMLDEYAYMGKCPFSFECNQFIDGCKGNCPNTKNYPRSLFFDKSQRIFNDKKKAYEGFDKIVFTCPQWVANRAKQSALLRDMRVEVLDEPVNFGDRFYPRNTKELKEKLNIDPNKKIVLTVAQLSDPRKGGKYFYDLAKFLEYRKDIVFVYVGCDTKEPFRLPNLIPIGFIKSQDELAEYYSLGDIFVCNSLADTMPNVCIDALGCGTPLAGFAAAGTPYVCTEEYGTFTPTFDIPALVDVVLNAQKKTPEIINDCRDYAVGRYAPEVVFKQLESIYYSLKFRTSPNCLTKNQKGNANIF